ncbi:MAG TPA: HAD family hydrolase [Pseudomonas sp.]|jgi:HAD superfamily hydrolase (TIGR01549 family)
MNLAGIHHWVFDMDGTLTIAVHDFPAIKRALDIPQDHDILGHLAALPADVAAAKHAWLLEHERELALASQAAPGAVELVRELAGRGYRLGILTRNARELAHVTLQTIGLADCFALDDILGRDEAAHKPDPAGLLHLAQAWQVEPSQMVMVGDYRFDLDCGRAAGARTILVNLPENPWPELTDWHAQDCVELRGMLG